MRYKSLKKLGTEKFRRLTGVKRSTFEKMVGILSEAGKKKRVKGGRKSKLSIEDRLLMTPLVYTRIPYLFSC